MIRGCRSNKKHRSPHLLLSEGFLVALQPELMTEQSGNVGDGDEKKLSGLKFNN